MTLVREIVTDAKVEQEARTRMALILLELQNAGEGEAEILRAEYDALDGSWQTERWIDMPVMSDAEAAAYTQAVAQQESNGRTLESKADQALADLSTFIALASPTNAQTLAAVKLLCRIVRVLIRLQLRKLDGTD